MIPNPRPHRLSIVSSSSTFLYHEHNCDRLRHKREGGLLPPKVRFLIVFLAIALGSLGLTLRANSQASHPESSQASTNNSSKSAPPVQVSTRMVTLEVVAKDHQGHHATGLTAADFQLFEQSPSRGKDKREQKIAVFREVRVAELAAQAGGEVQVPPGVYTNIVTLRKDPIPPTILLVDGLNTDVKNQAQIHVQMVRMLRSLPTNVPVAVFLFGHRLKMLQDFTTDPRLLHAALGKAISTAGQGVATVDPADDPDVTSAQLEAIQHASPELIASATNFEQEIYASTMDMRVSETIEALMSLGRHVSGFPGRKNLLWISTSFPISLTANEQLHSYEAQLKTLAAVLSEAKVAVYPINPAGVTAPAVFDAGTRPRNATGPGVGATLRRETTTRNAQQDSMEAIAQGTGGQICTGDNDLGHCVQKAVDDSSTFYEIAYYPNSENWNGEYRKITLKSRQSGLHLAYRDGYFASAEGADSATDQKAELQSACQDYLNATSIFMAAKRLPADSPEKLKFYLMANLSALTLAPLNDGSHELNLTMAVCTFDQKGEPLQLMSEPVNRKFDAKEYQSLLAAGGFAHILSIPGPKPAAVRLIVKDIPSGRLGSVHIKVDDSAAAAPPAPVGNGAQQPPQH